MSPIRGVAGNYVIVVIVFLANIAITAFLIVYL